MPYKSAAQRRFMHAKHPKIAKRWDKEMASRPGNLQNRDNPNPFGNALRAAKQKAEGRPTSGPLSRGGLRHPGSVQNDEDEFAGRGLKKAKGRALSAAARRRLKARGQKAIGKARARASDSDYD
jgi:hypothetical protein